MSRSLVIGIALLALCVCEVEAQDNLSPRHMSHGKISVRVPMPSDVQLHRERVPSPFNEDTYMRFWAGKHQSSSIIVTIIHDLSPLLDRKHKKEGLPEDMRRNMVKRGTENLLGQVPKDAEVESWSLTHKGHAGKGIFVQHADGGTSHLRAVVVKTGWVAVLMKVGPHQKSEYLVDRVFSSFYIEE